MNGAAVRLRFLARNGLRVVYGLKRFELILRHCAMAIKEVGVLGEDFSDAVLTCETVDRYLRTAA